MKGEIVEMQQERKACFEEAMQQVGGKTFKAPISLIVYDHISRYSSVLKVDSFDLLYSIAIQHLDKTDTYHLCVKEDDYAAEILGVQIKNKQPQDSEYTFKYLPFFSTLNEAEFVAAAIAASWAKQEVLQ